MHASSLLLASVAAVAVVASPAYPELTTNNAMPGVLGTVSDYFNLLAEKVQQTRQSAAAPVCDLSKAVFPPNCESSLPTDNKRIECSPRNPMANLPSHHPWPAPTLRRLRPQARRHRPRHPELHLRRHQRHRRPRLRRRSRHPLQRQLHRRHLSGRP